MPETAALVKIDYDARTDKGGRDDNQDAVRLVSPNHLGIAERGWLLVVCDGVGGEAGGHLASAKAADAALLAYYDDTHGKTPFDWLNAAVKRAHLAVLREATHDSALRRMSTTLVAAAVLDNQAYIAHVGDSRAYLLRGATGALNLLTRDHKNEATNSITRSLGAGANHDAELSEAVSLLPGDRLMLCSDGVYGVLDDAALAHILACNAGANDAAQALLAAALRAHTDDNVTVAVLNFGESRVFRSGEISLAGPSSKKWAWAVGLMGFAAVLLALALPRLNRVTTPTPPTLVATALALPRAATPALDVAGLVATVTSPPTAAPILEQTQQAQITQAAATRAAQIAAQVAAAKTRAARATATLAPTPAPTDAPTAQPAEPSAPEPPSQSPSPQQPTAAPTRAPTQVPTSVPPPAATSVPTQPPPQPTPIPIEATGDPGDPGTGRNPTATPVP
jgi:PPM family protein phosphatase